MHLISHLSLWTARTESAPISTQIHLVNESYPEAQVIRTTWLSFIEIGGCLIKGLQTALTNLQFCVFKLLTGSKANLEVGMVLGTLGDAPGRRPPERIPTNGRNEALPVFLCCLNTTAGIRTRLDALTVNRLFVLLLSLFYHLSRVSFIQA